MEHPKDLGSAPKSCKEMKKLRKKAKKEEEFLRELRKPKDTKVVLADRNLVDWLLGGTLKQQPQAPPSMLSADFPELAQHGRPKKDGRRKGRKDAEVPVEERSKTAVKREDDGAEGPSSSAVRVRKKRAKKDPVVIDIAGSLADKKRSMQQEQQRKKDRKMIVTRRRYRALDGRVLSGNALDSSNPVRKKGKQREVKKRKLSKLKMGVIRDRLAKAKLRREGPEGDLPFKDEMENYLSELTKRKLRITEEEVRREGKGDEVTEVVATPTEANVKKKQKKKKKKMPKYKAYCDNAYTPELDDAVQAFVEKIVYLQDKAFAKDPIHAHAKRRYVVGFRQVQKYLSLNKLKGLVVAPDLENVDTIRSMVEELKEGAAAQGIPCVFSLTRRRLGFITRKKVSVSVFGVLRYDGVESNFSAVTEALEKARAMYRNETDGVDGKGESPTCPAS